MANLNSVHRRSQAKCQLVRTVYVKRVKGFSFGHIINILLTELSRSVWENLDLGREYRPHCVRSVLHDLGQDSPIQTSCSVNKYLLLTEFEGRTVNYGPRFSPSIYGPSAKRAGHKSKGKNKGP